MRVVFMGTPDFAVPSLKALSESGYDIVGVFCQPDKPRGRGGKVTYCPIKEASIELSLPVFQPLKMRSREGLDALLALEPDVVVTAAYGQILSKANLAVPKLGTINVHASLLPKYRGPAPVQWAIINGETVTGVTTMFTDIGVDTGDIALHKEVPILDDITYGELLEMLSCAGAALLLKTLEHLSQGTLVRVPQEHSMATHYPMLEKEHGLIDFTKLPEQIVNLVRGVNPWPGAYTETPFGILKVWKAAKADAVTLQESKTFGAGIVLISSPKSGLFVTCGEAGQGGLVELLEIQAPGGKRMAAKDYLRGHPIPVGTQLFSNTQSD